MGDIDITKRFNFDFSRLFYWKTGSIDHFIQITNYRLRKAKHESITLFLAEEDPRAPCTMGPWVSCHGRYRQCIHTVRYLMFRFFHARTATTYDMKRDSLNRAYLVGILSGAWVSGVGYWDIGIRGIFVVSATWLSTLPVHDTWDQGTDNSSSTSLFAICASSFMRHGWYRQYILVHIIRPGT